MKRLALGSCLLSLLVINFAATAREVNNSRDESAAVRAAVTDYIESYYAGDAARMEKSLHPHYLKHVISTFDGNLRMTEKTGLQMVQDVRSQGPSELPKSEQTEQITVLDVSRDMASAKLVTSHWVDYVTLAKWNGEWKIVSVVLKEND
ncbi:MAG TPA: nuclear transport factor 2 family protein [Terriglobales bacterium]|nr:nuclear transport factor 2 family protein [Terriglobales bacterium]